MQGTPNGPGCVLCRPAGRFETALLRRAYDLGDRGDRRRRTGGELGVPVHTVAGDALAFKITTPLDLLLAEAVVRS